MRNKFASLAFFMLQNIWKRNLSRVSSLNHSLTVFSAGSLPVGTAVSHLEANANPTSWLNRWSCLLKVYLCEVFSHHCHHLSNISWAPEAFWVKKNPNLCCNYSLIRVGLPLELLLRWSELNSHLATLQSPFPIRFTLLHKNRFSI